MNLAKRALLLFTLVLGLSSAGFAQNLFWVTFGIEGLYMMQIDQNGNVTIAPKKMTTVPDVSFGDLSTAMTPVGNSRIVIWAATNNDNIYRILVDKNAFSTLSVNVTTLQITDHDAIAATHSGPRSFVEFETGNAVAKAYGLAADGSLDGSSWRVCPRLDHGLDESAVASDGGMLLCDTSDNTNVLYAQALNSSGVPAGTPKALATAPQIPSDGIEDRQVSNLLPDGNRLVIFRVGAAILSQKIDGITGNKVGGRKQLLLAPVGVSEETNQTMAIDPSGRFFLFTQALPQCSGHDALRYQALDQNGNPSGNPVTLEGCDFLNQVDPLDDGDIMGLGILQN